MYEWVPRAIVAFNEHFFREAFQTGALSSDIASRFYRTRRGERPTRSALTSKIENVREMQSNCMRIPFDYCNADFPRKTFFHRTVVW